VRLKARVKAASADNTALRAAASKGEAASAELTRVAAELAAAREALRALRGEHSRQQQRLRSALAAVATTAAASSSESATALAAAANAAAAAAAAASCSGASTSFGGARAAASSASDEAAAGAGGCDVVRVLVLLQKELAAQQAAAEGLQARLSEARSALERKNGLIKCVLRGRQQSGRGGTV
jgi:hypothetical protein